MIAAVFCLFVATATTSTVIPFVRRFALRRSWFDASTGDRKIHVGQIPRLGGIGIILGFYVSLACVLFWMMHGGAAPRPDRPGSLWVLVGGAVIAALGIYDDLRGADATTKLIVQIAVATLLFATGFRIARITTPLGSLELGTLSFPFTLLWIVGITNAVNLIDGLDGLAGGVALIALSSIFFISAMRHETFMMLATAALSGAVLGFLRFNFNPASIFMGDAGSMFLGFMVATMSIRASQKASTAVAIAIPIIALAIPIADTTLAITRRALRRQGLFTGDRGHIHHRLLESGLSQRDAVIVLYGISLICALGAVTLFLTQEGLALVAVAVALMASASILLLRLHPRTRRVAMSLFRGQTLASRVGPSSPAASNLSRPVELSERRSTTGSRRRAAEARGPRISRQ